MKIKFTDNDDATWFEYHDTPPSPCLKIGKKGSLNLTGLFLYGMYRNAVYDSYHLKQDLAQDIKSYKKIYQEDSDSKYYENTLFKDPLYHYASQASINTIKDWLDPNQKIKCYFAYEIVDNQKKIVGFVHFAEKLVNDKPVIHIAEAVVKKQGAGLGRRLMECVLSHYPENTHFTILTRVFNEEAKTLYHKRLKFSSLGQEVLKQLGYDNRYVGFQHITSLEEISGIKKRQTFLDENTSIKNNTIIKN